MSTLEKTTLDVVRNRMKADLEDLRASTHTTLTFPTHLLEMLARKVAETLQKQLKSRRPEGTKEDEE